MYDLDVVDRNYKLTFDMKASSGVHYHQQEDMADGSGQGSIGQSQDEQQSQGQEGSNKSNLEAMKEAIKKVQEGQSQDGQQGQSQSQDEQEDDGQSQSQGRQQSQSQSQQGEGQQSQSQQSEGQNGTNCPQSGLPCPYAETIEQLKSGVSSVPTSDGYDTYVSKMEEFINAADNAVAKVAEIVSFEASKVAEKALAPLQKTIDLTIVKPTGTVTTQTSLTENQRLLLACMSTNTPAFLVGPAGCGKSYDAEYVANMLKLGTNVRYAVEKKISADAKYEEVDGVTYLVEEPQYFYPINAVQQEFQLKGYMDAKGFYQPTNFYKAFKFGGVFLIDELDASAAEALILLNYAIANGKFEFPDGNGTCIKHPEFRVVATGNTYGTGADELYVGRSQIDAASLNRFGYIKCNYIESVERSLCNNNEELIEFSHTIRGLINDNQINKIFSYRQIEFIHKLEMDGQLSLPEIMRVVILSGLDEDSASTLKIDADNKYFKALKEA